MRKLKNLSIIFLNFPIDIKTKSGPVRMPDRDVELSLEVFPWNKNFETGHAVIDEQHQKLVELLNKLANTLTQEDPSEVNEAFEALANYADYHFEQEEEIWLDTFGGDNWFASHQLRHSSFLPKIVEIKEQNANKPLQDMVEAIVRFLIRWLAFHIIDDDKRLAMVYQETLNGLSLEEAKQVAERRMSGSVRVLIEAVMTMYDGLSTRTLGLMRERNARLKVEAELKRLNERLERLEVTDKLTGLYNRIFFESKFAEEVTRTRSAGEYLNLILVDIDHFKLINQQFGIPEGDNVLTQVANCLHGVCQKTTDMAFRICGEEFAILCSGESEDDATQFAETVRAAVHELKIPNPVDTDSDFLTVSIGVAKVPPRELQVDLDSYFKIADKCLYVAKKLGRNRVIAN